MLLSLASSGCYAMKQTTEMDEDTQTLSRIFLDAAVNGKISTVEAFVRKGVVDINVHPGDGWTAAKFATYHGFPGIVTFLTKKGANLNIYKGGETVLDVAQRSLLRGKPKEEMIKFLEDNGARTNEQLVMDRIKNG